MAKLVVTTAEEKDIPRPKILYPVIHFLRIVLLGIKKPQPYDLGNFGSGVRQASAIISSRSALYAAAIDFWI